MAIALPESLTSLTFCMQASDCGQGISRHRPWQSDTGCKTASRTGVDGVRLGFRFWATEKVSEPFLSFQEQPANAPTVNRLHLHLADPRIARQVDGDGTVDVRQR